MVSLDRPVQIGRSPFGELLVRFRTEMGFSQDALARQTGSAGVSVRSITNYEQSTNDPHQWILPHRPTIRVLASALSLTAAQQSQLVDAWDTSRMRKTLSANNGERDTFVQSGREHLLLELNKRWEIARSGTPQTVLLAAEAGMGKTSLATYFCDWVAAHHQPTTIAWGESTRYGATSEPYLAVRAATNRLLTPPMTGFTIPGAYSNRPELTTERVREIRTYLPRLAGALISDRTILNLSAKFPGILTDADGVSLEPSPGTDTVARWDEYSRLLWSLSQDWPLLIVLEDLHWSGDLTASLLSHIHRDMERATRMPIMILGTMRSDEMDSDVDGVPGALSTLIRQVQDSRSGDYLTMEETLSPVHGKAFITGLVKPYPIASQENEIQLVEWLYTHASGQPFLTTSMLQHLTESGALAPQASVGLWTFDPNTIKDEIPSAISNFIEQRLERIPRRGKTLLEACSIMGETISLELVARILDLDADQTIEFVDKILVGKHRILQLTGVYQETQTYRTYRFSHALVREYIYGTIPVARRHSLHAKAAEALQSFSPTLTSVELGAITNHYVRAEDWYGAEMAAYKAAGISVTRLDWDLSEFWFTQAEELAVKAHDPRQLWRTRAGRLSMLRRTGKYDEGLELGNRILRQVAYQDWPTVEALTRHHLGEMYYDLGDLSASVEQLRLAQTLHLSSDHQDLAAAAAAMLSHTTYRLGQFDVAQQYATDALELVRGIETSWARSEAVLAIANCEIDLGFYESALEHYQMAIDLARSTGKLNGEILPILNMSLCFIFMGRAEEAVTLLQELLEQVGNKARVLHFGTAQLYLGMALEALGRFDEAQIAYQNSVKIRTNGSSNPLRMDSVAGQLRMAIQMNDRSACEELVSCLETYIAEHTWQGMEYPLLVLTTLADAYTLLGNRDRSRTLIVEAHDELMRRASLLQDKDAIESYLNRVEMNVRVQEKFKGLAER